MELLMIKLCWIDVHYEDEVVSLYRLMNENDTKQQHETFKTFKREYTHLDEFFFSIC